MDPLTIMLLIGTAVSIGGSIASAASARDEANANAAELERSAALENLKGLDALKQGQLQAGLRRMRGGANRATQATAFAAAGVDASVGTPAQLGQAEERMSELDAATLENNAFRQAFGFKESGRNLRRQANALRVRGAAAMTSALVGGLGAAAQTGASLYANELKKGG